MLTLSDMFLARMRSASNPAASLVAIAIAPRDTLDPASEAVAAKLGKMV